MSRITKSSLNSIIICLILSIAINSTGFAYAQEKTSTSNAAATTTTSSAQNIEETANQEVNLDENVSAVDLGLKKPKLLPDNPFYFFKKWARGIQSFFTFNPIKKFELKSKFADEKLIEIKEMINQKKNPKAVEKAIKNYENEIEKIKKISDKIKEKAEKNPKLNTFLDKWTKHQFLHQKLLEKLEKQTPPQAFKKIKSARKKHLERFKDIMLKLENKDNLAKRLKKAIEAQKGSEFKEIKALEILKKLEKKAPEEAKDAIKKAQEQILKNTQKKLEKMPQQKRKIINDYLEKISGDPVEHIKILQDITAIPQLKKLRRKTIEKITEKIKEEAKKIGCPQWTPPAPGFCSEGRIIIKKDKNGCPLAPKCIPLPKKLPPIKKSLKNKNCVLSCAAKYFPQAPLKTKSCLEKSASLPEAEKCIELIAKEGSQRKMLKECLKKCFGKKVCITLWDPVCGEDNKTYSNSCFARIAGVKIAYKGLCKKEEECVQAGGKINRNPFLGPTNKKCCPGLIEKRINKSYSVCQEKPKPNTITPQKRQNLKLELKTSPKKLKNIKP